MKITHEKYFLQHITGILNFIQPLFGCANMVTVAFVFGYRARQRIVEAIVMAREKIFVKSFDYNEKAVPLLLHKLDNPQSAKIRCSNQSFNQTVN